MAYSRSWVESTQYRSYESMRVEDGGEGLEGSNQSARQDACMQRITKYKIDD